MPVFPHDRKRVQLVLPDDVVGGLEARALRRSDEPLERRHEVRHLRAQFHAADAVVAARDDAEELSCAGSVICDSHGGVAHARFERKHVFERVRQAQIQIARDKARLVVFDPAHHLGLLLDGLRDIDERDAALSGKANAHVLARDGLHDSGDHRDVHRKGTGLALFELHNRRFERDIRRNAVGRGIAGDKQIFTEGMRGFRKIICHSATSFQRFFWA